MWRHHAALVSGKRTRLPSGGNFPPSPSGIRYVERTRRGVDPDETPSDAVVREVWEETGLYIAPVRLLGVYGGPSCLVTYPNGERTAAPECAAQAQCSASGSESSKAEEPLTSKELSPCNKFSSV
jgi:8-oxo-dGTP pyrophosphatase MutT (NUDIX family)